MPRWISDLIGTKQGTFNVGRGKFSSSGLTAARTFTMPDVSGTLLLDPGGNGLVVRTAAGSTLARSVAAKTGGGLFVTNADGTAGNPTLEVFALEPDEARMAGCVLAPPGRLGTEQGKWASAASANRTAQSTLYYTLGRHGEVAFLPDPISGVYSQRLEEVALVLSGLTSARNYDVFLWYDWRSTTTNTTTDVVTLSTGGGWETGSLVKVFATAGGMTAGTRYFWRAASTTTGTVHTTLAGALANTGKVDLTAAVGVVQMIGLKLGPTWNTGSGSDYVRGTGTGSTDLFASRGLVFNTNAITNGPGAYRGVYVGTIRTTGTNTTESSQAKRFVWNLYHKEEQQLYDDDTTSHTITTNLGGTVRPWDNTAGKIRIEWVNGLDGPTIDVFIGGIWNGQYLGIGYNATNAFYGMPLLNGSNGAVQYSLEGAKSVPTGLGLNQIDVVQTTYVDNQQFLSANLSATLRC